MNQKESRPDPSSEQPQDPAAEELKPARVRVHSWDALVEHRIREAQQAGQFDNLPGFGKPLADLGDPHDENWWIRRKLRDEGVSVVPPSLAILKDIQDTLAGLEKLPSEQAVRAMVGQLNDRIRKAQFAVTEGPATTAMPVDVDEILTRWRALRVKSQH